MLGIVIAEYNYVFDRASKVYNKLVFREVK